MSKCTPRDLCLIIMLNMHEYQEVQREKKPERTIDVKRIVLTHSSLRKMSGRKHITPDFMRLVYIEMQELGWFMFPDGTNSEVLLKMDAIANWPRIGSKPRIENGNFNNLSEELLTSIDKKDVEDRILILVDELID